VLVDEPSVSGGPNGGMADVHSENRCSPSSCLDLQKIKKRSRLRTSGSNTTMLISANPKDLR
jgi:hypothetical protein